MDANAQADLRNSVTPPTRRLVNEPDGAQQFAAIRMVYMAITNGNPCAAAVLNQFEYRTNCRLPAGAGDRVVAWREQGEIWLTQGQGEMVDVLWGAFRKHEVKQAFKLLVDLGYLHKRLNPNNKFNKTLQYRFDLDAVQAAVDFWWCESWQPFEMPPIDAPDDARDHSTGDRQPLERSEVTSREVTDDLSDGHGRPQETPPATARAVTDGGKEESLSDQSRNQSRDQSPEERSGESRAPAREEPPPPPASEFHPIIQAFLDATPEALRDAAMPPNDEAAEAWDNMARRWADTMGATPEEVGEMVRMKWQKPTRDRYEFRWIEGDLVGWRRMQKAMVAQAEGDRSRFQAAAEGYDSFEVDLPGTDGGDAGTVIRTLADKLRMPKPQSPLDPESEQLWEMAELQISTMLQKEAPTDWARWQGATPLAFDGNLLVIGVEDAEAARQFQNRLMGFLANRVADAFGRPIVLQFRCIEPLTEQQAESAGVGK